MAGSPTYIAAYLYVKCSSVFEGAGGRGSSFEVNTGSIHLRFEVISEVILSVLSVGVGRMLHEQLAEAGAASPIEGLCEVIL